MIVRFLILFVSILFRLLFWAIIIQIVLSWFAHGRTQLGVWLDQIVRPLLWPFRWARIGAFDLSPILAFLVLDWLSRFVLHFLQRFPT